MTETEKLMSYLSTIPDCSRKAICESIIAEGERDELQEAAEKVLEKEETNG